ncbi:hypothetical protein, partial [Streptomyces albireticuli]
RRLGHLGLLREVRLLRGRRPLRRDGRLREHGGLRVHTTGRRGHRRLIDGGGLGDALRGAVGLLGLVRLWGGSEAKTCAPR